jgi:STE24 endopeptidase
VNRPPAPRADQLAALRELPTDQVAHAREFRSALRPGGYAALAVGLLIALLLGLTPLGARLVELAGRPFGGHWIARALLGGLAVVLVADLITLPFAAWRQSVLARYGLSTQGWGGWTVDLLKSYAVSAVIGAVALLGFYTVIRLAPRWWWAFGAAGAAGLVVLLSFILPVLVEPVFNRFTPMEQGPLRNELVTMAARDGVPVRDVLVADASRRTRAVNAYVSGLGPTRRVVVYDTLLREATPAEVTSVVAHELGHAKDRDVLVGTLTGALGAALAVVALYLVGSWPAVVPGRGRLIAEPPGFMLIALQTVAGLVTAPAQALISRRVERPTRTPASPATRRPSRRCNAGWPGSTWPTPTRPAGNTSTRRRTRPPSNGWPPPAPTPGRPADEPDAADHERLPTPPRRDPVLRPQPRGAPAQRFGGGLRVELAGRREVRRRPALRGGPRADPGAAAHPAGRPPGGPAGPRARLRHGLVRRGGPARVARGRAAPSGGGSTGWWLRPTGTRSAGRRCPPPGPRCVGSAGGWTSPPTSASTRGSGWPGRCTG